MSIHRYWLCFVVSLCLSTAAQSQILFTESFTVILDTSKFLQGAVVPDFKFQTQKKNLIEFENNTDLTLKFRKNAITVANKIEVQRYGKEVILSGGYVYAEYRRMADQKVAIEPYAQVLWRDARGLELKYATGTNLRLEIINQPRIGVFVGMGPFYEFERWNFGAVPDSLGYPSDAPSREVSTAKLATYVSLKLQPIDIIDIDISGYHQANYTELFTSPRLAGSFGATYNFSEHLGLTGRYQIIYDYAPIVPIRNDFHKVTTTVSISF